MLKFNLCMSGIKTYVHQIILALVLIMGPFLTFSQTEVPNDSLSATPNSVPDTLSLNNAALPEDSVSSDVVNQSIFYDATDSIVLDALQNKVLLYGDAIIKYETMVLEAAFVEYSFADNMACAAGVLDTAGVLVGKPQMNDNGQKFTQDYLCYNFKTKKGYSKMSVTQEGDAIFIAEESKRQENEWIHIRRGKFTTCDAENPHYHFQLSKAIIIPNDKVVSGPLYLKIRKVPLPLGLPFGWFPTKNESSHGIIIPGYGNANNLGYFLKDGGYYFPIGRFVDTRILGDIYSRGSWSVKNITNYKRRYKYSGAFNISRTVLKTSIILRTLSFLFVGTTPKIQKQDRIAGFLRTSILGQETIFETT
jgi:lipopolysaccharide assembly outer membrane protein LptD (OstA)